MSPLRILRTLAATGVIAALVAPEASAAPAGEKPQPAAEKKSEPNQPEKERRSKRKQAEADKARQVKAEQAVEKQPQAEKSEKLPDTKAQPDADESAVLQFAKANHPELAALLDQMRASNPKGYQAALAELTRAHERLQRIQERMPDRYETELGLWKLDSRIRLLAAQSAMSDSGASRGELRELLQERRKLRLARLQDDRARQEARLEKIEASIAELEAGGDDAVDAELEQLLSRAQKRVSEVRPRKTSPTSTKQDKTPESSRKQ